MARNGEQVTTVVKDLVHEPPRHKRDGALVYADEEEQHEQGDGEQRPRPKLTK
jgi:hypothetical protein